MNGYLKNKKEKSVNIFLKNLLSIFTTIFVITLVLNLFYKQIVLHYSLDDLYRKKSSIKFFDKAERGLIKDRKGYVIATSINSYNIYVSKKLVKDKENVARILSENCIVDYYTALKKLSSKKEWIPIKFNVDENIALKLKNRYPSIIVKEEKTRYYNKPEVFSNVVGFVGVDDTGLEGIEYKYDKILKGRSGYITYQKKPNGKIYKHPLNEDKPAKKGKDIILTLDYRFQEACYNIAKEYCEKFSAKKALVIVLESKTGEIFAIAEYPSYNSNLHGLGDISTYQNYGAVNLFEPGSVFKIVVTAAAIEAGVDTSIILKQEDEDTLIISKRRITDSHDFGKLNFKESFTVSSNIAFVNLGKKLGKEKVYSMIKRFKFLSKTYSGFPGEQSGQITPVEKCREINFANLCFGQGISVTALQLVAAYNCIANDGIYINPKIVKEIDNRTECKNVKEKILQKNVALKLKELLLSVVENGTGTKAKVDGIKIAGKTGTAEKYVENTGYKKGYYISSFVGFFPVDDPEFTILTLLDEPKNQYWASETTAPMFSDVLKRIINLDDYRFLVEKDKDREIIENGTKRFAKRS
ncbi:MAG: penicillin-binding protein 2 [candidate division WOR-3 bacterium]